jgi:diguanylate cyclase
VAEKIREAVAGLAVPTVGQVTISIGISQARSDDAGADDAVRRADEALYRAKEQGRNRVAG